MLASLFFGLLAASPVDSLGWLQDAPKAKVTLSLASTKVVLGKQAKGVVKIVIPIGFHGYQNPPKSEYQIPISLAASDTKLKFKPEYPKGLAKVSMGEESAVYEGTLSIPFVFSAPGAVGKQTLTVKATYQLCDDSTCFPPETQAISVTYHTVKAIPVKPVKKP